MLANFRLNSQTNLVIAMFALLTVLSVRVEAFANEALFSSGNRWIAMKFSVSPSQSQILHDSLRAYEPKHPTFVITHGMGGTEKGDRFHQLADGICKAMPECNVLIVDWSKQSCQTGWFRIPIPFAVAQNINPVASEVSELLKSLQIDPTLTTFIGESFGNCVNARIAAALGGRGRILAFNSANAAGGYPTPDLRACSDVAWSFQTYSMWDTQDSIADFDVFLETSPSATDTDQHIAGVSWLAKRVKSGDLAWLLLTHKILESRAGHFDATGTASGELLHQSLPRQRPVPIQVNSRPAASMFAAAERSGRQD
jgi:hypothetical protein